MQAQDPRHELENIYKRMYPRIVPLIRIRHFELNDDAAVEVFNDGMLELLRKFENNLEELRSRAAEVYLYKYVLWRARSLRREMYTRKRHWQPKHDDDGASKTVLGETLEKAKPTSNRQELRDALEIAAVEIYPAAMRKCRRRGLSPEDAEDVLQIGYVNLLRRIEANPVGLYHEWMEAYLWQEVGWDIQKHYRTKQRRSECALPADANELLIAVEDFAEQFEREQLWHSVQKRMARLDEEEDAVFRKKMLEEKTWGVVAAETGLSESTAKRRLKQALHKLTEEVGNDE